MRERFRFVYERERGFVYEEFVLKFGPSLVRPWYKHVSVWICTETSPHMHRGDTGSTGDLDGVALCKAQRHAVASDAKHGASEGGPEGGAGILISQRLVCP